MSQAVFAEQIKIQSLDLIEAAAKHMDLKVERAPKGEKLIADIGYGNRVKGDMIVSGFKPRDFRAAATQTDDGVTLEFDHMHDEEALTELSNVCQKLEYAERAKAQGFRLKRINRVKNREWEAELVRV